MPHEQCPVGHSAEDNPVVRTWGEKPVFTFTRRATSSWEKSWAFSIWGGGKDHGQRFALYTGLGARLERTLINFLLDLQTRTHGYTEVSPPLLVNAEALVGTTQLPKFEEQLYRCERDDLYLVPRRSAGDNLHRRKSCAPNNSR